MKIEIMHEKNLETPIKTYLYGAYNIPRKGEYLVIDSICYEVTRVFWYVSNGLDKVAICVQHSSIIPPPAVVTE